MAVPLLLNVDVYIFDMFGTTVDWFTTIKREVARRSNGVLPLDPDAADFAREWRQGYYAHILRVNAGGEGSLNIDIVHREILDRMIASPRWFRLSTVWDDATRSELVHLWHDLDGKYIPVVTGDFRPTSAMIVYEDTIPGLTEIAKSAIVVTLSNGNYRLLVDVVKNKQLPLDSILSTEFFGVYKPSKQAYLSALYHLCVPPERVAMVAAHRWDLEGAAHAGLKTVYVPRPAEDDQEIRENMRSKTEGGDVDLLVKDFKELAAFAAKAREYRH